MSWWWKAIMGNYFRILQSHGLPSRTVIRKLSTCRIDYLNILLVAYNYPPVPRSSMRNTMLAQIHKYVQQFEITQGRGSFPMQSRFLHFWGTNQQIANPNQQQIELQKQCETFLAAQERLPATWRHQSRVSNAQPGVSNQPINQQSRQSLCLLQRPLHSIQRETGDTWMPISGDLQQGRPDQPA